MKKQVHHGISVTLSLIDMNNAKSENKTNSWNIKKKLVRSRLGIYI